MAASGRFRENFNSFSGFRKDCRDDFAISLRPSRAGYLESWFEIPKSGLIISKVRNGRNEKQRVGLGPISFSLSFRADKLKFCWTDAPTLLKIGNDKEAQNNHDHRGALGHRDQRLTK